MRLIVWNFSKPCNHKFWNFFVPEKYSGNDHFVFSLNNLFFFPYPKFLALILHSPAIMDSWNKNQSQDSLDLNVSTTMPFRYFWVLQGAAKIESSNWINFLTRGGSLKWILHPSGLFVLGILYILYHAILVRSSEDLKTPWSYVSYLPSKVLTSRHC